MMELVYYACFFVAGIMITIGLQNFWAWLRFWWRLRPVTDERLETYCAPAKLPHPAQVARLEMARWRAQRARRQELLEQEWRA